MAELRCWSCDKKTEIVKGADGINLFSICTKCNPAKTIELVIQGCEAVCEVCKSAVPYDNDYVETCAQCGKFVCDSCYATNCIEGGMDDNTYYCSAECYKKLMYQHKPVVPKAAANEAMQLD